MIKKSDVLCKTELLTRFSPWIILYRIALILLVSQDPLTALLLSITFSLLINSLLINFPLINLSQRRLLYSASTQGHGGLPLFVCVSWKIPWFWLLAAWAMEYLICSWIWHTHSLHYSSGSQCFFKYFSQQCNALFYCIQLRSFVSLFSGFLFGEWCLHVNVYYPNYVWDECW